MTRKISIDFVKLAAERDGQDSLAATILRVRTKIEKEDAQRLGANFRAKSAFLQACQPKKRRGE